jgi:hypothetical protein
MKRWLLVMLLCSTFSPLIAAKKPVSVGISHKFFKQDLMIYIDQNTVLTHLPSWQKAGVMDKNLSKIEANLYKPLIPAALSIPYVSKTIQQYYSARYQNAPLHVTAYLIAPDIYGNNQVKTVCYSFNFTHELYQKINWRHFQAYNLIKVVPDFNAVNDCKNLNDYLAMYE